MSGSQGRFPRTHRVALSSFRLLRASVVGFVDLAASCCSKDRVAVDFRRGGRQETFSGASAKVPVQRATEALAPCSRGGKRSQGRLGSCCWAHAVTRTSVSLPSRSAHAEAWHLHANAAHQRSTAGEAAKLKWSSPAERVVASRSRTSIPIVRLGRTVDLSLTVMSDIGRISRARHGGGGGVLPRHDTHRVASVLQMTTAAADL